MRAAMKNPLNYQMTEYDCGPTTLMNAISYLFDRERISPDILKNIMMYCLDSYNGKGEAYKRGTSDTAMWFIANWLNQFGRVRKFPVECKVVSGPNVRINANSEVMYCLQQKGVVIAKVMLENWHYVLLTDADEDFVYLFDPYFRKRRYSTAGIEKIEGFSQKMNCRVRREFMNRISRYHYSLGPYDLRAAILMYNKETRLTADTIEYII